MKIIKKITLITFVILFSSMGLIFYFNYFQGFVTMKNNKINYSTLLTKNFVSTYTPKIKFETVPEKLASDVHINILGTPFPNNISILKKSQRYYIPLDYLCNQLDYNNYSDGDMIFLKNSTSEITFSNNNCLINNNEYKLRGELLNYTNTTYLSISDIENIFNLTAYFDNENKTINLLNSLSNSDKVREQPSDGKIALIRLEDFSAGATQLNPDIQMKYKILANNLYNEGIKYHIAWVPRYKSPSDDFDNDLLANDSFENAGFINILDYFINHGGEIGLHGYTHQYDDSTSLIGTELSSSINSSEADTRNVIEKSIDTATALNIPYSFFESPHYKASTSQKDIAEEYFNCIYEPRNIFLYTKIHKRNNTLYIPTPLGYVENLDTNPITNKLKNPNPGQLASLFYHPYLELDFIDFSICLNNIKINYNENSPLKKIVKSIKENKYITCHISDLG